FAVKADARAVEALGNLAEANRQRERADIGFREARQTVDKYYTTISESKLLNVPGLQPLRKELLESALDHYQKFIDEYGKDASGRSELGSAYIRVGNITREIGSKEQSLVAYQRSIDIFEDLVREN